MSRQNPTVNTSNPSTRWFEWKGGDGVLSYYNKDEEDPKKRNVTVPLPFRFLILEVLCCATGYNDKHGRLTSNEVKDINAEPLLVRFFKGGEIANGLWANIKKEVKYNDGSFTQSIYVAYKDGDKFAIGNIKMAGCARGAWLDFKKLNQDAIWKKAIVMKMGEQEKNGATKFFPPTFSLVDVTQETEQAIAPLDRTVEEYLKGYLKQPLADKMDQRTSHDEAEADQRGPADDEPEEYCEQVARRPHPSDPDPDDLLDIPF